MPKLAMTILRFAIAAWVGAASLFVVDAVEEATSPVLDSATKGALALLRFPSFYLFGFVLVSIAFVCAGVNWRCATMPPRRMLIVTCLLGTALIAMICDYVWIYKSLAQMLAASEEARPANFQTYHQASMYVNSAGLGLCFIAALLACWPFSAEKRPTS